jgi:hypothetical protein
MTTFITFFDDFATKKVMATVVAFFGGFVANKVTAAMSSPSFMVVVL